MASGLKFCGKFLPLIGSGDPYTGFPTHGEDPFHPVILSLS